MAFQEPSCCDTQLDLLRKILESLPDIGGGSGDVSGPNSSVDGDIAIFSGVTGKIINDSGVNISSIPTSANFQAGTQFIGNGKDTIDVVFSPAFPTLPTTVVATIGRSAGEDLIECNIDQDSITVNGFTAHLSATTSGVNYVLNWSAFVGSNTPIPPPVNSPIFKTNIINSLPVVRFNQNAFMKVLNNAGLYNAGNLSFFVVWKVTTTTGSTWMFQKNLKLGDTGSWLFGNTLGNNKVSFFDQAGGGQLQSNICPNDVAFQETVIDDGVNAFFRRDGAATTSPAVGGAYPDNGGDIYLGNMVDFGGNAGMQLDLAEFLFYTEAVNNADRDSVEGYLLDKYALGVGAPFDPTTVPGLKLWLKADALVLSDGDQVITWTDSSGSGNDANS